MLHHQLPLVGRERPRVVHEARRQRQLADVLEEQPGAELLKRVLRHEPATDQQAEDGRVDRVLDDVERRSRAAAGEPVGVLGRQHLVDDSSGHLGELDEDLVRKQGARHDGRLLEGARQRGACVIARPERKRVRSLGLHRGFIGNPASGPNGGYARFNDALALPPPPPKDL